VRIIGGKHKGRRLAPPKLDGVRPTTDFARESLFSLIENRIDIEGINALDLCCGTGAISFELTSRGANSSIAVDKNVKMLTFIKQQASELDLPISTVKADIFKWLKTARGNFDLIFVDPPYQVKNYQDIPTLVFGSNLVDDEGWLIIEHPREVDFSNHPHFESHRTYGAVHFSFFTKNQQP
jgi:16S rRNA (guanine966-N2)-methyltransferase